MQIGDYTTHPAADVFGLLPDDEHAELVASIRASGLELPITLCGGLVLDGRNRLRACLEAGVPPRFTEYTGDEPEGYVWRLNSERRHLTPGARVLARSELHDQERERKARETESRRAPDGTFGPATDAADLPPWLEGGDSPEPAPDRDYSRDSRSVVAAATDTSPRFVSNVEAVRRDGTPEVVAAVRSGRLSVDAAVQVAKLPADRQQAVMARVGDTPAKVDGKPAAIRGGLVRALVKQEQRAAVAAELAAEAPPMPEGPYRVIVADPPWSYTKRAGDATHRADLPYPPMSTAEIAALQVAGLAHPDGCVLWLWTTNAFMRDAFEVLDAWGFEEKTILTWVKDRMGLGDWLRGKTEHCIMAIRGKPTVTLHNETTELRGALREHSRKPEEFYALVEALCPGSKVEMFCRTPRSGWAMWGAETSKFHAA